jgi:hypothetical protein
MAEALKEHTLLRFPNGNSSGSINQRVEMELLSYLSPLTQPFAYFRGERACELSLQGDPALETEQIPLFWVIFLSSLHLRNFRRSWE